MEKSMGKITASTILVIMTAVFFLGSNADAAERRTVLIGARNDGRGTAFVDENGRFTGLEGETLQLIITALPQYDFELRYLPQRSLFPSLISNKVDMVHGNLRRTEEREQQAIRTRVANNWWPYILVVPESNTDIQSLKDLEGKRVVQNQNSGQALLLEKYIRNNKANIELVYSQEFVAMLADKHADATFMSPFTLNTLSDTYKNFKLKMIDDAILTGPKGTPDGDTNTYFWFRPEDTQLRDDVSAVLEKLRADGSLSKISVKFTGIDYPSKIDTEAEKELKR
ncbi:MAG: transporter substrate-binding domain-containing protein [Zoogloeaceae bacterium]|nr:transporter substrate-binding domain-containing protein [Zoogloeaceae bacterium]